MSEYQYYEFRAVDQPLTRDQMAELRALSSRADITPTRFCNTYNYGDFRGDPHELMETLFDAHVYISNFGVCRFLLRFPREVVPGDTLALYATEEALDWWTTEEGTIVEWQLNDEPTGEWVEGEGWMDRLLPLRDELVRGDYHSLYIGWLSSLGQGSPDEDEDYLEDEEGDAEAYFDDEDEDLLDGMAKRAERLEPPVPAGLRSLTTAQKALAELLSVSHDLLAAAATDSPEIEAGRASAGKMTEWVAQLPNEEMRAALVRVIRGEGLRVQTELQSRFHRSLREPTDKSQASVAPYRRTAASLVALAEQAGRERQQRETAERERKRHAHLAALIPRFSSLWATIHALVQEQKASGYEKACTLLVDLRDAYTQAGRQSEFDAEFGRFVAQNARRTALMRRLKQVQLVIEPVTDLRS